VGAEVVLSCEEEGTAEWSDAAHVGFLLHDVGEVVREDADWDGLAVTGAVHLAELLACMHDHAGVRGEA